MKVGILTFHHTLNYGACLQALATQETIRELGEQPILIDYRPKSLEVYNSFYHYHSLLRSRGLKGCLIFVAADLINFSVNRKQQRTFDHWYQNFYTLTPRKYVTNNDLKNDAPDVDVCIVGSDQVWNSEITEGLDPAFFLNFGSKKMKRVSYAASIGKDVLSDREIGEIATALFRFDQIALREKTHTDSLAQKTKKNVTVTVDPTLLHNADKWRSILGIGERLVEGNYIFYHSINSPSELSKTVVKLQKMTGYPIVRIGKHAKFENEKRFPTASPSDFVNLIDHAAYVVTDSFHGVAFSLNFGKQVLPVLGAGRNSRVKNLLMELGLEGCARESFSEEELSAYQIDYDDAVMEKLQNLRGSGTRYLQECLRGNSEGNTHPIGLWQDKKSCCGCGLCSMVCPVSAITMLADDEGFLYPYIQENICIECRKCVHSCQFKKDQESKKKENA